MATKMNSHAAQQKPLINSKTGNGGVSKAKSAGKPDEIVQKFSKNLRRVIEARDCTDKAEGGTKSVSFNPEIIETSFGGTQTPGRIKGINPAFGALVSSDKPQKFKPSENGGTKSALGKSPLLSAQKDSKSGNQPNKVTPKTVRSTKTQQQDNETPASKRIENRKSDTPVSITKGSLHEKQDKNKLNGGMGRLSMPPATTPVRRNTDQWKMTAATPECFNPVTFETPAKQMARRGSVDDLFDGEDSCAVSVAVRVRPANQRELTEEGFRCVVSMMDQQTIVAPERGDVHRFTYDHSFWSYDKIGGLFASQEFVYNALAQPMLGKAFEGYNTCLFAYGQTGSGKSYSMMGNATEPGIVPRFCEELFDRVEHNIDEIDGVNVELSFFEIYNEKIHDLLGSTKDKMGKKQNLKVREHPALGPYVEGLSSYVVKSYEDVKGWLNVGNKYRATAATGMNDRSSRSHSVFTMVLTQTKKDQLEGVEHEHAITSKINLIDLAGSERQSLAKTSGERLREGASINKSLMSLGKVISLLSDMSNSSGSKKKKFFIPYRDSVLTWLLRESLGGNSKTTMLATVSPANTHIEETLSTLRYAKQAHSIINMVRVNEDPKARLIRELRGEIEKLRSQTGIVSEDVIGASLAEITSLRDKLALKEQEMVEMTRTWHEKLQQSEQRKKEEARILEKSGIAFKLDNKLPNLVNLNEDPQLSEMLLYIVREGQTHIGRMRPESTHEIQLNGPLIADNHCVISNVDNKKLYVEPEGDAPTYVNGNLITEKTLLHHGDRVILGGDHYFRLNHPVEMQKCRNSGPVPGPGGFHLKDFEFARQELITVQNERLEAELEEARKQHEEQMERELQRQRDQSQQELERNKQQANLKLSLQKHVYEDRLADLQQQLSEKKQRLDKDRMQAETKVQQLEQEKMMLEQEVLANRKRLEMEAKAAQKSIEDTPKNYSRIVERLQEEKQKIRQEVERLEALKMKRLASTPRGDTPKADLYKTSLLLREANKISHHLKKPTTFVREDIQTGGTPQTYVKVTNNKLGVSTMWSMDKFEARLVQMRELYQGEADNLTSDLDEVFFDPQDPWEREDRVGLSPTMSPGIFRGPKRQITPGSVPRLTFDSASSTNSPALFSVSQGKHTDSVFEEEATTEAPPTSLSMLGFCKEYISATLSSFKGDAFKESISDKVLVCCESIKQLVASLLDTYNQTNDGTDTPAVYSSRALQEGGVQLSVSLSLLMSHSSLWLSHLSLLNSPLVTELGARLTATVRQLASHTVLFLQGCDNDIDSMVQDSAAHILDSVFQVCRQCGELSLATESGVSTLRDTAGADHRRLTASQLGHDVRQCFISGCDTFIDKTLQGGLKTLEECEDKLKTYSDEHTNLKGVPGDVLKQVELTTASSRVLLQKLQYLQVELDSTIRDSLSDGQTENYYHHNFVRCQGLITHISNMTDGVSMLTQAAHSLLKAGADDASIRRLYRCADMVQRSTTKIAVASNSDTSCNSNADTDNSAEFSVLSDAQLEQLDYAAQEVKVSTATLLQILKRHLPTEIPSPCKTRRTAVSSPRGLTTTPPAGGVGKQRLVNRKLGLFEMKGAL